MNSNKQPLKGIKWYQLYFVLAAFGVGTVVFSLFLSHHTNVIFTQAVETNSLWLQRLGEYGNLQELASAVNAPGNDVFESGDADQEEARLRKAYQIYQDSLKSYRTSLNNFLKTGKILPADFKFFNEGLQRSETFTNQMVVEASAIFDSFRKLDPEGAGARMATMDRMYAEHNTIANQLANHSRNILVSALKEQYIRSEQTHWIEYIIMLLALLMIVGVSYYGHRLSLTMKKIDQERTKQIEELELANCNAEFASLRMQCLAEQAPVGIFETDKLGNCTYVNARWSEISGLTFEQAQNQGWGLAIHPEDRERVGSEWQLSANAVLPFHSQYRFMRPDGHITWVQGKAAPIRMKSGQVSGYVGALVDITQLKEIEHSLKMAQKAAEETSSAKSDFLANISHEIRTPMNGILGLTELLLNSSLNLEQKENANLIHRSASSLLMIINDILDFSKIEAGKMSLNPILTPLKDSMEEIVEIFQPQMQTKGLQFNSEYRGEDLPFVYVDIYRLKQVLINLLGNALKFTPKNGSIHLVITTRSDSFETCLVEFKISDTGIGIPLEKQKQVFEAFTQVDTSSTRNFGGTGLGLSISSRLVKLLGGELRLYSELGQGSIFSFSLLMRKGEPSLKETVSQPPLIMDLEPKATHTKCFRILLAEDNIINQRVALRILEQAGHQVTIANNGQEALEKTFQEKYDLILMDIQMPLLGGDEATIQIRNREKLNHLNKIPIIAVTANAMEGDRDKYLALGMDEYITKPINRQVLLNTIHKVCEISVG